MKNLTQILGIAIFSLSLFACSQKEEIAPIEAPQSDLVTATYEIEIGYDQSNGPSNAQALKMGANDLHAIELHVTYNVQKEQLVSWMMEDDVYQLAYERKGITRQEIDDAINKEIQLCESTGGTFSLSNCIERCKDKYTNPDGTKKPGRGDCKFWCVVEWLGNLATRVVSSYGLINDNSMGGPLG